MMTTKRRVAVEEAKKIGSALGLDWTEVDLDQFRIGLEVELEHGTRDPETNVTGDDMMLTGKIALAHIREFPDYYTRLEKMEAEAEEFWSKKQRKA
jgi:Protein of unknown function (DUF5661)